MKPSTVIKSSKFPVGFLWCATSEQLGATVSPRQFASRYRKGGKKYEADKVHSLVSENMNTVMGQLGLILTWFLGKCRTVQVDFWFNMMEMDKVHPYHTDLSGKTRPQMSSVIVAAGKRHWKELTYEKLGWNPAIHVYIILYHNYSFQCPDIENILECSLRNCWARQHQMMDCLIEGRDILCIHA